MPKIPLYNQGQGGTVKTATGALSPRANVGAFTAPGQAQAAFFQKAGQVAFQFGMAEKQAETDKAKRDITTLVNQEMNNWTNENQDTTVEGYQASAQAKKQQLQTSALETFRGSLTRRQFAEVSGAFDTTFATKLAQGSQIAFAKNQKIRTESADNYLDGMYSELVSLNPNSDLYQQKLAEVNSQYDAFIGQGITPTKYGNRAAFAQTLDAGIFGKSVESASTQAQIDGLREQTSQKVGDLSPAVFSARNKALDAQENVIQAELTENVFKTLSLTKDEELGEKKHLEETIEIIRSGKDIDVLDSDGNIVNVDISQLKSGSIDLLISKLRARYDNISSEKQNAMMLGLDSVLYDQDTTLSDVIRLEEQLSTLTGRFAGLDDIGEINQARSAINAAKTNIARKELTNALEMQRDLIASISSKKGEEAEKLSEEDEANLATITSVMNMAGREDLAFQLNTSVQVEQQATKIFNGIQFGTKDTVTSALNKASQNVDTNVGKLVYEKLQAKVAARDKEIQNDFVGYYIKERGLTGKRPEDMPTATQLITIQKNMGIPELDIRVASNNQMIAFKDAYDQAETYQEKAAEGAKFLNSFGIHQDRVMRHLMKTGTISLVDNLIMAYPTDVGMKAVSIFNEAEQIKRYKGEIPKDQRDVVFGVVTDLIGDYSSSVIGGVTNDVLGGGVTSGRASHVFAMRDIVANTAQGYILSGQITDPEKAAEQAYNDVMGNHFEFTKLGNDSTSSIRLEKGAYQYPQEMTDVLNISLTMNEDYLRSIVSPPPPRQGASPQEAIEQENRYFRELGQYGSWRTTTDNKSVYLVDQLGNVVTRKNAEGQSAFITVPLDKVSVLGTEFAKMGTVGEESYVSSISGRRNAMLEKLLTGQLF